MKSVVVVGASIDRVIPADHEVTGLPGFLGFGLVLLRDVRQDRWLGHIRHGRRLSEGGCDFNIST